MAPLKESAPPPNEERGSLPLTQASSLPGKYFHDYHIYEEEMERIFRQSWLCLGRTDDLPEPGSFALREVGDESIIAIRGNDGQIRSFYNVCRHRGSRVLEEDSGKGSSIKCPYHSWTYSIEGKLIGAPHTDNLTNFDKDDYPLHPYKMRNLGRFPLRQLGRQSSPYPRAPEPAHSEMR